MTTREKMEIVEARERLERAEAALAELAVRIPELEAERARVAREVAMTVVPGMVVLESRRFTEAERALDLALSDRQVARDAAASALNTLRRLRDEPADFGPLPQLG